jgi:2-C-methyl-D-erythritol 4-phosphate cytidylyltransferase
MSSSGDAWAVIVAAGAGTRFGGGVPKQFVPLLGRPMALWAVEPFLNHPAVLGATLVVPGPQRERPPDWLRELEEGGTRIVAGGAERTDSVRRGLRTVPETAAFVAVHDGARPLLTTAVVGAVLEAARTFGCGVLAARRVSDTLKEVRSDERVVRTVARKGLWRAETPQVFPREMLVETHERAADHGALASDCAGLCERYGLEVRVVEVFEPNLKVTHRADIELAEAWLRARGSGRSS